MKQKRFEKKLAINKSTISNLDSRQMLRIQGGIKEFTVNFTDCASNCLCNTFGELCRTQYC